MKFQKKKLLIATDSFLPRWDGIARFLSEIIPKISKEYDITVLAPGFKGRTKKLNAKIIRFNLINIPFGDIYFSKPNLEQIKQEVKKTDLVLVQTIGTIGIPTVYYAKKLKKPIMAQIHSIEWDLTSNAVKRFKKLTKWATKGLARYIYNKCNLLLVPSEETAALLRKNSIKTLKSIVHLGTNANKFKPPIDKNASKKKLNIPKEKIVIGYCGRIGREKDLKTLYRAFSNLRSKYKNLLLLLVGDGVKEQINFFKNKNGVIVTGSKNNIIPYLKAIDIYVLPSLTETTSLSTTEAMAVGLPVITTRVGRLKEYIKPNKNGLFFPEKNSYVLKKKLELLINNEKLRNQLGINARKTIIKEFSWERTIKDIEKALSIF